MLKYNLLYSDEEFAIVGCSKNVKTVKIPKTHKGKKVTSIECCAFYQCCKLTSVTIPNSVTRIEECAFEDCISLTDITIPDSVTCIKKDAFKGCPKIKLKTTYEIINIKE